MQNAAVLQNSLYRHRPAGPGHLALLQAACMPGQIPVTQPYRSPVTVSHCDPIAYSIWKAQVWPVLLCLFLSREQAVVSKI